MSSALRNIDLDERCIRVVGRNQRTSSNQVRRGLHYIANHVDQQSQHMVTFQEDKEKIQDLSIFESNLNHNLVQTIALGNLKSLEKSQRSSNDQCQEIVKFINQK